MRLSRKLMAVSACLLVSSAMAPAAVAQDANHARNLAATCATCHGTDGKAVADMKPLAGMSADKIRTLVADYRSGAQPSTVMQQIARGYTDLQIGLIAGYFAAQKPAR